MIVPVDRQIDKAQNIAYEIGVTAISAIQSEPCGTFNSSTIIVMIIAITPSLNAARRSLPMTLSLLVQQRFIIGGNNRMVQRAPRAADISGLRLMSALLARADIRTQPPNVRFVPKADIVLHHSIT